MKKKLSRGFTLIELLVSIAVFSIIMTLSTGAYLILLSLDQRAQGIAIATNNLSFILDGMTRSMRTGNTFRCGGNGSCANGTTFTYVDVTGKNISYSLSGGAILLSGTRLTDQNLTITDLRFDLIGGAAGDGRQPRVRMVVRGTVNIKGGTGTLPFSVETTSTIRGIDS